MPWFLLPWSACNVGRRHQIEEHPNLLRLLVNRLHSLDQAPPVEFLGRFGHGVLLNVGLLFDVPRADPVVTRALNLKSNAEQNGGQVQNS